MAMKGAPMRESYMAVAPHPEGFLDAKRKSHSWAEQVEQAK